MLIRSNLGFKAFDWTPQTEQKKVHPIKAIILKCWNRKITLIDNKNLGHSSYIDFSI